MKPGVYPDMSMSDYLRLPAFSASLAHALNDECEYSAWFQSWLNPKPPSADDTHASDAGSIAHSIFLLNDDTLMEVIDPEDHPAEKTGAIPIGFTNKSIKAARDYARERGKIPVLRDKAGDIRNMVDSARNFVESLKDTEPEVWASFQPGGGQSEVSCLWDDAGVLCRMRPDRISGERRLVIDPKFTERSAEPSSWARTQMGPLGYRLRSGMYRRGARSLFGTELDYKFLVIQQKPPHLCSLVGLDPASVAMGDEQARVAVDAWRRCVAAGRWNAYPNRTVYPEPKAWELAQWSEGTDADGIPYDISKLFERRVA